MHHFNADGIPPGFELRHHRILGVAVTNLETLLGSGAVVVGISTQIQQALIYYAEGANLSPVMNVSGTVTAGLNSTQWMPFGVKVRMKDDGGTERILTSVGLNVASDYTIFYLVKKT